MSITIAEQIKEKNPNSPSKVEDKDLPKNPARGAAWAGGISGFLVGGPIGAALVGWLSWRLARTDAGTSGIFCRKAGDFTNRLGNSIRGEWDKSKPTANKERQPANQEEPKDTDRNSFQQTTDYLFVDKETTDKIVDTYEQTSNFTSRLQDSIKGEWNEAAESCRKEEEEGTEQKNTFLHKGSKFLSRVGGYLRQTWDESKSIPLVEAVEEPSTKHEEELTK